VGGCASAVTVCLQAKKEVLLPGNHWIRYAMLNNNALTIGNEPNNLLDKPVIIEY